MDELIKQNSNMNSWFEETCSLFYSTSLPFQSISSDSRRRALPASIRRLFVLLRAGYSTSPLRSPQIPRPVNRTDQHRI